jgi:hypothetical protein
MANQRIIASMLTLVLLLLYSSLAASAETSPVFTITAPKAPAVVGQDVRVIVTGDGLEDLFGFEIQLTYDSSKLEYKEARSAIAGYSIPMHEEKGELVFAHTKVGRTKGDSGKIEMAAITFRTIAEGNAAVELKKAKLVNSAIKALEPEVDARINLDIRVQFEAFTDLSGHWAKENIEKAGSLGLVDGYPDGAFRPQQMVTRAEFTSMLVRALSVPEAVDQSLGFTDLLQIPSWAVPSINKAVSAGIVVGYGDGTFRAAKPINRAEIAVMAMRAIGFANDSGKQTSFADRNQIPTWAHGFIADAVEQGIMQGRGNNYFVPNANTTRAEAVTLMLRVHQYGLDADLKRD